MLIITFFTGLVTGVIVGLALGILWLFRKLELPEVKEVLEKLTPHIHEAGMIEPMSQEELKAQENEWTEFNEQLESS